MTTFTTNSLAPTTHEVSVLRRFMLWTRNRFPEYRACRAQIASLRQLKSRDLKDIGLIENDISAAIGLPLSSDAAMSLQRASLGRSGNW
jgi:uncharacterized protein YjiS (DUF1127 family)